MAHGAPTAVAPSYSDTVQPPIPTLLLPVMPATGWTMQQPPYHQLTTQPTVHPMATDTLSPVPAQIRQKIIQGEFIDFSVLLHRASHKKTGPPFLVPLVQIYRNIWTPG